MTTLCLFELTKVDDGTVLLKLADLKALNKEDNGDGEDSGEETVVDDSETSPQEDFVRTERIITRNTVRNQALQINAALEKDMWKEINRLTIQDNVAEDQSLQVNYAMSHKSISMLFDRQDRVIAASRQRQASAR
jgi:hypothetical protein